MNNLTVIYYTSNYLEKTNPYFLHNTRIQFIKAIGDLPVIIVSQKPTSFINMKVDETNVCVGELGRSHLNIYRQILEGAKAATTEFVALAEDDILYSYEHFHNEYIGMYPDKFLYDMNKVSVFTWIKPALFSFRHDRMVVNQLIAPRKLLIEALEERFMKVTERMMQGEKEEKLIKYWGDLGRYEDILGVTVRPTKTFMCKCPSIVFSHENAFGYLNHGKKKRLGDLRIKELEYWGRAEDAMKLYFENYTNDKG